MKGRKVNEVVILGSQEKNGGYRREIDNELSNEGFELPQRTIGTYSDTLTYNRLQGRHQR